MSFFRTLSQEEQEELEADRPDDGPRMRCADSCTRLLIGPDDRLVEDTSDPRAYLPSRWERGENGQRKFVDVRRNVTTAFDDMILERSRYAPFCWFKFEPTSPKPEGFRLLTHADRIRLAREQRERERGPR